MLYTFAKTFIEKMNCVHDDEHSGHEENDAIQFNTLILSIYLVLYVASIG